MRCSTTGGAARPGGRLALAFAFAGLVSAAAASGFDAAFDAGATAVDRRFAVWPLPPVKPLLSSYVLTTDKTTGLEW